MSRAEKRLLEKQIKKAQNGVPVEDREKVANAMRNLDIAAILSNPAALLKLKKDPSALMEYVKEPVEDVEGSSPDTAESVAD